MELKLLENSFNMVKPQKKPRGIQPWWLTDATETCPACSQSYAYHTEIRCLDCDGPLCPICVQVTTTFEFSCPDCVSCDDPQQTKNPAGEVSQ